MTTVWFSISEQELGFRPKKTPVVEGECWDCCGRILGRNKRFVSLVRHPSEEAVTLRTYHTENGVRMHRELGKQQELLCGLKMTQRHFSRDLRTRCQCSLTGTLP